MAKFLTYLAPIGIALVASSAAFAGPPAGVPVGPPAGIPHGPPAGIPHGPPAGIPSGPPAAATSHIPQGVGKPSGVGAAAADKGVGSAARLLGKLNAAHASDRALERASSKSVVGVIAKYKSDTQTAQADVTKYTDLVAEDQVAVGEAQEAVDDAQALLDAANAANPKVQADVDAAQATLDAANADLTTATNQLSADQASLAAAQQDILDAQTALAASTNKTITPDVVVSLNDLLGI